ncbi:methionine--tRNA ligase [Planomicrobium sp. CPCC 101079]|uniref:methionine--tRNA ligase n=1 Tax=Planomicrobium sp. CPCC 101079 TaxID=2599618 RepID=UPI0011B84479|nr:methionine--tRNA ligase [Planomicrobium sp. CPCC 101079]TWT14348.1 methionine--tRNA ligase [Planomicrobium sp. CPCC 101079]
MNVLIGGAWPYANGSLHLGHIAALLPGDILARYYRLKGEDVLYVSGSDCNGTPISIRASQEGVPVKEIADRYHAEFQKSFQDLGFSYDLYTRTDAVFHHQVVQNVFLELQHNGYIYKKEIEQTYCEFDKQFLPDRFVEGICPVCGAQSRGDQCDNCSTILDALDLLEPTCKICGNPPTVKKTEHFYFELSLFQKELEQYAENAKDEKRWRENAINLTERYLNEGLVDRAVSRDLPNGVSLPVEGYEDKKIYVWIEAVSGYYSASKEWAALYKKDDGAFWQEDAKAYYVHGKDNIPFHTIIWPAILKGIHVPGLPTHIVSNEYLTLEKKKLSTSKNWAVWVPDVLKRYHPDSIRYFLSVNAPENRDTDFSWREFIYSHNSELLGAYGNFVNRTLKFIQKSYGGAIPQAAVDPEIEEKLASLYKQAGSYIEKGHMKQALETIFNFVRLANKYFDEKEPWKEVKSNPASCEKTIATCMLIINNLVQLLHPFLPFSTNEVKATLGMTNLKWELIHNETAEVSDIKPLFERYDVKRIDEELEQLISQSN